MDNKYSEEFAKAFRELLDKYDMTLRAAEMKGQYSVSFSYLSDWMRGRLPQYPTLKKFLEHWPLEDRIQLMKAAGYPLPAEWETKASPKTVTIKVDGIPVHVYADNPQNLPREAVEQIEAIVRRIVKEEREKKKEE